MVLAPEDEKAFIQAAREENLEATVVARVTDTRRMRMKWRGRYIVDISREFLDTNGVEQFTDVSVLSPSTDRPYFSAQNTDKMHWKEKWLSLVRSLNICSQRGLAERFDSTIGAATILLPYGGRYQLTPAEGMAAKIPVLGGETNTATLMAYGFNPDISTWSPFHGAVYAIVEAVAKITAMGRLQKNPPDLQEYFKS